MRHALRLISMAVFLTLAGAAVAGQLEEGQAAFMHGDFATALQLLRPLADHGDARAQLSLGHMYASGRGVPQNYAEALKWYRLAADQGDADAQFDIGLAYATGQGVPQNYAEAAKWYRLALYQGYKGYTAQESFGLAFTEPFVDLGVAYANGHGVPQDHAEAAKWFRLAADQGDATAQFDLGLAYATGQGVPQDHILAHMWFNLAAAQGNQSALKNRDIIAAKMTRIQIAEAQRLAREWKPKQ